MNIQLTGKEPPEDATVFASVQRVEERVLASIRVDRSRQRRVRVGVGALVGLGVFAGGVVVGAAALPPSPNPGENPGVTENAQGHVLTNQFAIDCYTSLTDTRPSEEDETTSPSGELVNAGELADERDPVGTCATMQSRSDFNQALVTEADALASRGFDHGFIQVIGDHIYHFERGFGPNGSRSGWSIDDGVETTESGITITATIALPAEPTIRSAVCEVASNWVKVYPLGSLTANALCGSLGLQVWQK
jgi:hypothetical protein